jgi:hypothetical protein
LLLFNLNGHKPYILCRRQNKRQLLQCAFAFAEPSLCHCHYKLPALPTWATPFHHRCAFNHCVARAGLCIHPPLPRFSASTVHSYWPTTRCNIATALHTLLLHR